LGAGLRGQAAQRRRACAVPEERSRPPGTQAARRGRGLPADAHEARSALAHGDPGPARSVLARDPAAHYLADGARRAQMNLALFALDNTLLACDSDYEWGQFLVDRGVLSREEYEAENAAFYEQYKAGTLDIHEFLGFALRPLAQHTAADLERWHADFMTTRIRPAIGTKARDLVPSHLQRRDL